MICLPSFLTTKLRTGAGSFTGSLVSFLVSVLMICTVSLFARTITCASCEKLAALKGVAGLGITLPLSVEPMALPVLIEPSGRIIQRFLEKGSTKTALGPGSGTPSLFAVGVVFQLRTNPSSPAVKTIPAGLANAKSLVL